MKKRTLIIAISIAILGLSGCDSSTTKSVMTLDLEKDYLRFYEYLETRIQDFSSDSNANPGETNQPVTFVQIGFEYDWQGWIAVVFDTRPGARPDGEWNGYIEECSMAMPHWHEILAEYEGPISVKLHDGSPANLPEIIDDEWACNAIGEMIVAALEKARAERLFEALPLASECFMGVEHNEGAFGWPPYDDIPTLGNVRAK